VAQAELEQLVELELLVPLVELALLVPLEELALLEEPALEELQIGLLILVEVSLTGLTALHS
jgi:hypothetical protein